MENVKTSIRLKGGQSMSGGLPQDLSIVICGEAGQGIQTIEAILTKILHQEGYKLFATKEYMSRIRGGSNSTEIRVSSQRVGAFVQRMDILIPLDKEAFNHVSHRLTKETVIFGDEKIIGQNKSVIDIPLQQISSDLGSNIYISTATIGLILALFNLSLESLLSYVSNYFSGKPEKVIANNLKAVQLGYQIGSGLLKQNLTPIPLKPTSKSEEIFLNGSEAIALGAIAGGCNFISSYPMSPGTGVLTYLAQHAADLEIIAEQAEDEISAINMALGAWYAGARSMVTTSGGGFALMVEGVSLAGMLELPLVIHLGQRPGPATGLPTRTEQGDLELVLYSGHGEFPRIILAPSSTEQAFYLTQKAFNLADKYQIPVFILTDQYLLDSYITTPRFNLSPMENHSWIVETSKDYRRYKITDNGISPRGIPGFGQGLVCVDSDEHDETGHITEDLNLRKEMVDKRLRKLEAIQGELLLPEFIGSQNYRYLVVSWGSNYHGIRETMELLGRDDLAAVHLSQVYPIHPKLGEYLKGAKKVIMIENNATGQLGKLIKLTFNFEIHEKLLKYDGLPFGVEELVAGISNLIGEAE